MIVLGSVLFAALAVLLGDRIFSYHTTAVGTLSRSRARSPTPKIRFATTVPGELESLAQNPFVRADVTEFDPAGGRRILREVTLTAGRAAEVAKLFPSVGMGVLTPIPMTMRRDSFSITLTRRNGEVSHILVDELWWSELGPNAEACWDLPPALIPQLKEMIDGQTPPATQS